MVIICYLLWSSSIPPKVRRELEIDPILDLSCIIRDQGEGNDRLAELSNVFLLRQIPRSVLLHQQEGEPAHLAILQVLPVVTVIFSKGHVRLVAIFGQQGTTIKLVLCGLSKLGKEQNILPAQTRQFFFVPMKEGRHF